MADDIKINPNAGQNPQDPGQQGQSSGWQAAGGQPGGGQAQPAQSQPGGDQLNPVIDLRNIDQKPGQAQPPQGQPAVQAGGQVPATAQPQPTTGTEGAVPPQGGAVSSGRRKTAILLGEEEEEQMQAPPQEKYSIPSLVQEKFPDLIQLIKETESMNDEERDYWFQILPIMTEEQIKKFRDILVNEKQQLTNLDKEYEQELQKLNEKHMIEWKEFETKEKRKTLTTAEKASKEKEKSEEEELLKRLSQI